jgi:hypothetical protein
MKKGRKKSNVPAQRTFGNDFVRGALVSGIVEAIARHESPRFTCVTARTALQGGAVLAAATVAADALETRRYFTAVLAAAGAAASVYLLRQALPNDAGSAEDGAALQSVS